MINTTLRSFICGEQKNLEYGVMGVITRLLIAVAISILPQLRLVSSTQAESLPAQFQNFMGMEVCVDATGAVQQGVAPTDPNCHFARKLRPGEPLPYHLMNWEAKINGCRGHATTHDDVPIVYNGVQRDVTVVRIGYRPCGGPPPRLAYVQVHWVDDAYASILGAWSRGKEAASSVGGGVSDLCEQSPHDSGRSFRQWVLGAVTLPPEGTAGYAVFRKHGYIGGLPPLSAPCPTTYPSRFLATWAMGTFQFKNGSTLLAVVSHPYSQADDTGTTPGQGRQMERTYWTREFGETRWEGWKRDDYVNRKTGRSGLDDARDTFAKGVCNRPFEMPSNLTPGVVLGPVEGSGAWSQTLHDLRTGQTHTWYMASCSDLTNIVRVQTPGGDPFPDLSSLPTQFWSFWAVNR